MSGAASWVKTPRWVRWLSIVWSMFSGVAAADEAGAIRLGYFPNITHAQALYARATGAFEQTLGVPIKWVSFNAGPSAIESLFADAVDATFVGPSPTINGYIKSRGEKFVIVAGAASGGAGLVVRKDADIQTEEDFHGKVIATPQVGNTQDVAARSWFSEHGYRLKSKGGDLTLIALSNPDQLTMFKKKQIHGAWTIEPWLARLEVESGGVLFLDEKALWPEGKFVTTHLVVNKSYLASNPGLIRGLLTALVEVTQVINTDKRAAVAILNEQLKRETGKALKDEVIQRAMTRVEFTWDPMSASLKKSAEVSREIGFIRTAPQLHGIYSLSFLNQVLAEKNLPLIQDPKP